MSITDTLLHIHNGLQERCPHAIVKPIYDVWFDELEVEDIWTYCELSDRATGMKRCVRENRHKCEIYNEWLKEVEDDNNNQASKRGV